MLSVLNWEQLIDEYGWSQRQYIETTNTLAKSDLLVQGSPKQILTVR